MFVIHLLASTNVKKFYILFYKLLSSVKEVLKGSKFIKSNAFVCSLFFTLRSQYRNTIRLDVLLFRKDTGTDLLDKILIQ